MYGMVMRMPRGPAAPDSPELWGLADIARATGKTNGTIRWHKWRGHLPEPDKVVGRSPVWKRTTIAVWVEAHKS